MGHVPTSRGRVTIQDGCGKGSLGAPDRDWKSSESPFQIVKGFRNSMFLGVCSGLVLSTGVYSVYAS